MLTEIFPLPPNSTSSHRSAHQTISIFPTCMRFLFFSFGCVRPHMWNCMCSEHIILNLNKILLWAFIVVCYRIIAISSWLCRRRHYCYTFSTTIERTLFAISISSYLRALFVYFNTLPLLSSIYIATRWGIDIPRCPSVRLLASCMFKIVVNILLYLYLYIIS